VRGGTVDSGSRFVQLGSSASGYGKATKAVEFGNTAGHLNQRRDGRHRRSQMRTEPTVVRTSETRGSRGSSRRLEKLNQRKDVSDQVRLNVVNTNLNTAAWNALERGAYSPSGSSSQETTKARRIAVGVDEGERRENGRGPLNSLPGKELVCMRNSHAPSFGKEEGYSSTSSPSDQGEMGLERRVPRKTGVEVDQRTVNREGKRVWTTGIGATPTTSTFGAAGEKTKVRWEGEEQSDPYEEMESERRGLYTRGRSTIDGVWNDRYRPNRYDYYREGHGINRASKEMAKCSIDQEKANVSTTLSN